VLRRDLSEGEYNVSSGQKLIYMPDQLGSVRDVIDATSGSLVESYDFTPYGATARSNGSTPTDYRYAGLFKHPASGLNLSATRPMDTGTGRWLNRDTIRETGGINLYGYVGANPVMNVDTDGLAWNHKTGKTIDCGNGCSIRIDYTFNDETGQKSKHLYWECYNGRKSGHCGENGDPSHKGDKSGNSTWDDVPEKVKECARQNGFQGDPLPQNVPKTEPPTIPNPVQEPDPAPTTPIPIIPIVPIPGGGGGDPLGPLFGPPGRETRPLMPPS
jgi:RHS repeat-associated protein